MMHEAEIVDEGFDELIKLLQQYEISENEVLDAMETGVKEIVRDLRKLPRPRSQITKASHTHLLDSITYERKQKEIVAGWGQYYGPMVENGTVKMKGTPHVKPTFRTNQKKYFETVKNKLWK